MPLAIIALHLALISAAILLLMLICSTGNFWRYPGAGVWICLDLMVSIAGLAFARHPEYHAMVPNLAKFHFTAMGLCLAWMAVDNLRNAQPLSGLFFWGFAAFAAARVCEEYAFKHKLLPVGVIEIANAAAYLVVVALLISALLLPVPPEPVGEGYGPFLGDPAPPVAALAAVRARE